MRPVIGRNQCFLTWYLKPTYGTTDLWLYCMLEIKRRGGVYIEAELVAVTSASLSLV